MFALWPFERTVIRRADAGTGSMIGNIIWIVLCGWWLAIAHIVSAVVLWLTIIGIPLGLANFRRAPPRPDASNRRQPRLHAGHRRGGTLRLSPRSQRRYHSKARLSGKRGAFRGDREPLRMGARFIGVDRGQVLSVPLSACCRRQTHRCLRCCTELPGSSMPARAVIRTRAVGHRALASAPSVIVSEPLVFS